MKSVKIRQALPGEGPALTELALASKSIWDYTNEYIENCRDALTIDEDYIRDWPVLVAEINSELSGFAALKNIDGENRLDHLWIHPDFIKHSLGTKLFSEAKTQATKLGWPNFRLAADPYAVGFYEKMGAQKIGEIQSRIKPDLYLPHMEYLL